MPKSFQSLPPEIQQKLWDWEQNPAGLIKPSMTLDLGSQMLVLVGGELIHLHKKMNSHEFLVKYSTKIMGEEWGTEELKKPIGEQHPLIKWYREMGEGMKSSPDPSEIFGQPARTPYAAYVKFSYDLYLLRHHFSLPDSLVARLRHVDQFQGARYELSVAAAFIRAGFSISFESAFRADSSHCEFDAKNRESNKVFTVEAKSRHRDGILGRPGKCDELSEIVPDIERLVRGALKKDAKYPRIVFIDLNLPPSDDCGGVPEWVYDLGHRIDNERKRSEDNCPSAFLFFTNQPFQFMGADEEHPDSWSVLTGINIPAFDSLTRATMDPISSLGEFPEIEYLFKSLSKFSTVPITFQ